MININTTVFKIVTFIIGLHGLIGNINNGSSLLPHSSHNENSSKPNVILIAIDDLNDWVGVYGGNPQIKTPYIDRFAEKAVVFKNASCPGPVCGPSRSALLSGFMPSTTGIYGNSQNMLDAELVQQNTTLPEYFSKNGYLTISKGKIFHKHTTKNGLDHGHWAFDIWEQEKGSGGIMQEKLFSRNKGIFNGKVNPDAKFKDKGGTEFAWAPTEGGIEKTKDYLTAKWFADKLKDDYKKPFFMAVGLSKPHLPWYAPEEFFDMYKLDTIDIPEYRLDDYDDILDKNGEKVFEPTADFKWVMQDEELFKRAVRAYMASSSYADYCAGIVLDALEKSRYAENTIVILFGDHGWHLGEKLRFRKAALWRESTQLPLIIRLPGMKQKQFCSRNVNLIDLYPTLIDLCDLPEKNNLDGRSIKPLLKDVQLDWYPALTCRGQGSQSVMTENWHYINYGNGVEELYNLKDDPMEWINLANSDSKELFRIKNHMKSFMSENDADPVPKSAKNKSMKQIDQTIKLKRKLEHLK